MYGEFVVAPEVCLFARLCAFGIVVVGCSESSHVPHAAHAAGVVCQWAGCVQAVRRVEHVVVIDGQRNNGHAYVFVDEIRLRRRVHGLPVHKFRTADHRVFGNLFCCRNGFRVLGGEGTVECAFDLPALGGGRRIDCQVCVETRRR